MSGESASETLARDVSPAARKVWLTFDDGSHPEYTRKILDVLKARSVVATFFVVGKRVEREGREPLERAHAEGHGIGNHTVSHKHLAGLSEAEVRAEILDAESLIADLLGPFKVFRPPYGESNAMVDRTIEELGYFKALWNADTRDWDPDYQPDGWVRHAIAQVRSQSRAIVLAHDRVATTADHVVDLIDGIEVLGPVRFEPFLPVSRTRLHAGPAI